MLDVITLSVFMANVVMMSVMALPKAIGSGYAKYHDNGIAEKGDQIGKFLAS
jgi:hypothetical protein